MLVILCVFSLTSPVFYFSLDWIKIESMMSENSSDKFESVK